MNKENYGEGYMKSLDFLRDEKYQTYQFEITSVHEPGTLKAADGSLIPKHVVGVKGSNKKLVLCKSNVSFIIYTTGQQFGEKWIGKKITVQVRDVESFGEIVPALRVIPPKGCRIPTKLYKRLGTEAVWVAPS